MRRTRKLPQTNYQPSTSGKLWRVSAWRWKKKKAADTGGVGEEVIVYDIEDRELALAAAHMLLDRYAPEASPIVEIDVCLTGPLTGGTIVPSSGQPLGSSSGPKAH